MYFLLKMGIFHCYVSLPEGTSNTHIPRDPIALSVDELSGCPITFEKQSIFRFHETILRRWARIPRVCLMYEIFVFVNVPSIWKNCYWSIFQSHGAFEIIWGRYFFLILFVGKYSSHQGSTVSFRFKAWASINPYVISKVEVTLSGPMGFIQNSGTPNNKWP